MIRNLIRVVLYGLLGLFLLSFLPMFLPAITGGVRGQYLRQQKHYAKSFKTGDTNVPLFAMDWFGPTVHFCRVSQSGKGSARRDVGHAIQSGGSISLNETNFQALVQVINQLPLPPKHSLPVERQIVVGCIRSNQWFSAVYDRANVPEELEKVAEITGASLPWYIPQAFGYPVANAKQGKFSCTAMNAPIFVSQFDMANGVDPIHPVMQVWDINQHTSTVSESSLFPDWTQQWETVATSPEGNIVAVASSRELYVVDWKTKSLLWSGTQTPRESGWYLRRRILIAGEKSQYLLATKHSEYLIYRLDLLTGQELGVLGEDIPKTAGGIGFLEVSRNGKILVAGYGNQRPKTFAVWEVGKDQAVAKFTEPEGASANISPDGELIALCRFGHDNAVFYRWRTGERTEVRLRNSGSSYSVYWSPDCRRLAAYVDTYPASIIIYDTATWKPIARWKCGQIGESSKFCFGTNGILYQIRNNEINALDVSRLKSVSDD